MFLNLDQCVNCEGVEQGLASFPTHIEQHIIICYIHFDILTAKKTILISQIFCLLERMGLESQYYP